MVVLKRVKSATLIEVVIASLLIVVIFVIASLTINNLLLNNFSRNTHGVETRLNELEYQLQNNQINLPYQESYAEWQITMKPERESILLMAQKGEKIIVKTRIDGSK